MHGSIWILIYLGLSKMGMVRVFGVTTGFLDGVVWKISSELLSLLMNLIFQCLSMPRRKGGVGILFATSFLLKFVLRLHPLNLLLRALKTFLIVVALQMIVFLFGMRICICLLQTRMKTESNPVFKMDLSWAGSQRIHNFMWKLAHGRLLTNTEQVIRGMTSDSLCSRCSDHLESIMHVLCDCGEVRAF